MYPAILALHTWEMLKSLPGPEHDFLLKQNHCHTKIMCHTGIGFCYHCLLIPKVNCLDRIKNLYLLSNTMGTAVLSLYQIIV